MDLATITEVSAWKMEAVTQCDDPVHRSRLLKKYTGQWMASG